MVQLQRMKQGLSGQETFAYDPLLRKVTVRSAETFPRQIFDYVDDIEILDMSYGHLTELPDEFARLRNLKALFLSNNDFEEIPAVLSQCPKLEMIGMKSCKISRLDPEHLPLSLRALILTDNKVQTIPTSIGRLADLQKLTLTGNLLTSLPKELMQCNKLELIRLAVNQFLVMPDWLLQLPRLAWYGDAGNPGSRAPSPTAKPSLIAWSEIILGDEIGKSPKNVVHRGVLGEQDVAIKLYGGNVTADGDPADEIQLCLVAGQHKNIITTMGELSDTPGGKRALAMEYVPSEFKALAGPPDFATLTRDVYARDQSFTVSFVANVLRGVAAALAHLHGRGIMHGDMYAHNILVDAAGRPYLGDFGAASYYDPADSEREYVEVRAFAVLMDELLSRCIPEDSESDRHARLCDLQRALLRKSSSGFSEISDLLARY